ncbi:MAG: hypothetical protein KA297_19880 [Kofleriaceae bacterium]|jgi:hypothetical protein|nr:hypothetical protein [Kofleriaceae bacterium]
MWSRLPRSHPDHVITTWSLELDEFGPQTTDAFHRLFDHLAHDQGDQPSFDTKEVSISGDGAGCQGESGDLSVLSRELGAMVMTRPLDELRARLVKAPDHPKCVQDHHAGLFRDLNGQALHVRCCHPMDGVRDATRHDGDIEACECESEYTTRMRHGSAEGPRLPHEFACVEQWLHAGRENDTGQMPAALYRHIIAKPKVLHGTSNLLRAEPAVAASARIAANSALNADENSTPCKPLVASDHVVTTRRSRRHDPLITARAHHQSLLYLPFGG